MNIKLVIWDLDETMWRGVVSEGSIEFIDGREELIRKLSKKGVINSICSHNYFDLAIKPIKEKGLEKYFVFPKISWKPKGPQIAETIGECQLRTENVLFIDDRPYNLREAQYFCPGIHVLSPDEERFSEMMDKLVESGKEDNFVRLNQYKILEQKCENRNRNFSNEEEFLRQSSIKVLITPFEIEHLDRVHELIVRANQLNFTKRRASREKLIDLMVRNASFVVHVSDRFGDYGLVGFVSYYDSQVEHFVFSCRILNMGVESFVFHKLNMPVFKKIGQTAYDLRDAPDWIESGFSLNKKGKEAKDILMIGGCDLGAVIQYIDSNRIETYFNYTDKDNPKNMIHRDSIDFLLTRHLTKEEISFIVETCPFVDNQAFDLPDFKQFNFVVYSPLIDYVQGKYKSSRLPEYYLSCSPYLKDGLSKKKINDMFTDRGITIEKQEKFIKNWRYVEKTDHIYRRQLARLFCEFSHCHKVIIILPASRTFSDLDHDKIKRHEVNNLALENTACLFDNISFVKMDTIISCREDFTNSIRHYGRHIYFKLAKAIEKELGWTD